MVFPPMSCFRLLFLRKALIGSTEKVFSKTLIVFKMDQWEAFGYMSLSVVTFGLSTLFLVLENLSYLEV